MHVLYIHQYFATRDSALGTRSYEFAKRLIAAGHPVTVVCAPYERNGNQIKGSGIKSSTIEGIEVRQLGIVASNYDGYLKRAWSFLRFALYSCFIALTARYDLVIATSTPLTVALPGIVAKIFRRKPFIFEIRDLWPDLPRAMGIIQSPVVLWLLGFVEYWAYRCADGRIALAPGIKDGIEARLGHPTDTPIIPNASDTDLFVPAIQKQHSLSGIGANEFVAVFTGAHGIANGLDSVIAAASILQARGRRDIKIVLIGDGKMKPRLQHQVKAAQLDNCIFLDPLPKCELSKLLPNLNAGLMILKNIPEFYRGTSPNKFFDYLAAGLPVIVNYPGWVADLVEQHHCGIAVPPDDPAGLADALEALADDSSLAQQYAVHARQLSEQQFNREKLAKAFVEYLENIYSRRHDRNISRRTFLS